MGGFFLYLQIVNQSRIKLINCSPDILGWILTGDQIIAKNLNVKVPKGWTENGIDIFKLSLNKIRENPKAQPWWTYLAIDINKNVLIGSCGFKGEPIDDCVEIGYEVCSTLRNKGFATEMVKELIEIAFSNNEVKTILAHTIAKDNPSVSVLKKCGFKYVGEIFDDEEGKLYKWELIRKL